MIIILGIISIIIQKNTLYARDFSLPKLRQLLSQKRSLFHFCGGDCPTPTPPSFTAPQPVLYFGLLCRYDTIAWKGFILKRKDSLFEKRDLSCENIPPSREEMILTYNQKCFFRGKYHLNWISSTYLVLAQRDIFIHIISF